MKIWTCGSSPRSGSRNAWKRIKNVNGASRLSNIWNFFVRRDPSDLLSRLVNMVETWLYPYYSETKQQSMEWRHSDSLPTKKSECNNPLEEFSPRLLGIKTASSSVIIFQRANDQRGVLLISAGAIEWHIEGKMALATQKKLPYLVFQCLDHPSYSPDLAPSDCHLFPGLKKKLKDRHFCVRRGSHCCRGDLIGRTIFRFFLLSWKS